MTKTEATIALLNEQPELADDPKAVAEHIDCSRNSARRYITTWEATKHIDWALDALTQCRTCKECIHLALCQELEPQLLHLPCERVTEDDLFLAQLEGTVLDLVDGREVMGGSDG